MIHFSLWALGIGSQLIWAQTPLYSTAIAPVIPTVAPYTVSASVPASIYAGAPLYSPPVVAAPLPAVGAPLYSPVAAPLYSPPAVAAPLYSPYASGGYGGGGYGGFYDNPPLLDFSGRPVYNTIRNDIVGGVLDPLFPGVGGIISTANDVNLLGNAPGFINNVFGGQGYGRDPFKTFVRNDFYANRLGRLVPGLGGPLSLANRFNLISTLLA